MFRELPGQLRYNKTLWRAQNGISKARPKKRPIENNYNSESLNWIGELFWYLSIAKLLFSMAKNFFFEYFQQNGSKSTLNYNRYFFVFSVAADSGLGRTTFDGRPDFLDYAGRDDSLNRAAVDQVVAYFDHVVAADLPFFLVVFELLPRIVSFAEYRDFAVCA